MLKNATFVRFHAGDVQFIDLLWRSITVSEGAFQSQEHTFQLDIMLFCLCRVFSCIPLYFMWSAFHDNVLNRRFQGSFKKNKKTKLKETKWHSVVKLMSVFNGAVVRRKNFYVGLIEHIFVKAH